LLITGEPPKQAEDRKKPFHSVANKARPVYYGAIFEIKKEIPAKEETMPNLSGSFSGRATSQSTIALHDVSNHDLNLLEVRGVQKSPDEKWNNSKITYWGTADLIAGNGAQRGYFVNEHSDGDRDFGTFEGRIATPGGQVTIEGAWNFTGGTGKFKGLTGSGSYKGRMTSPVEVENTWEGKYQIAAKTQAA